MNISKEEWVQLLVADIKALRADLDRLWMAAQQLQLDENRNQIETTHQSMAQIISNLDHTIRKAFNGSTQPIDGPSLSPD